jgi:hypothetical protein
VVTRKAKPDDPYRCAVARSNTCTVTGVAAPPVDRVASEIPVPPTPRHAPNGADTPRPWAASALTEPAAVRWVAAAGNATLYEPATGNAGGATTGVELADGEGADAVGASRTGTGLPKSAAGGLTGETGGAGAANVTACAEDTSNAEDTNPASSTVHHRQWF